MALWRLVPLALLAIGLAACSPYNYGKEIAEFSKDVDQVASSYKAGYTALASDRASQTRRFRILDRAPLALTASCRAPVTDLEESTEVCTLERVGQPVAAPRRSPEITEAQALDPAEKARRKKLAEAAGILQDYAHGLAAVTNAEDRAAFDKSVSQLSAAVDGFSALAPGIGKLAPVAINLFGWAVGTALDQQRFDALRAAVTTVGREDKDHRSPIHTVQVVLSDGLARINRQRRTIIVEEAQTLLAGLGSQMGEDAYRQRLAEVEALVAVLEGLRRADPEKAGNDLEKAHKAIVAAVNDPSRQYASLLKALGDFKDKATALKEAIAATPEAASTSKKGK